MSDATLRHIQVRDQIIATDWVTAAAAATSAAPRRRTPGRAAPRSAAKQNTPASIGGAIAVTAGSTAKQRPVSPACGAAGSTDSGTCRSTKTSSQLVNGYCAFGSTAAGSFRPAAATFTQIADALSVHW